MLHAISSYKDNLYGDQVLNPPEFNEHQYWILKNLGSKNENCFCNLRKINLLMGGGGGRGKFLNFFCQFFSTCEKITQILEFSKYQGGKI